MATNNNRQVFSDASWYLLGAAIPMLVLFIRSPIYTRVFSPAEYGYYSLVNITFTYLSSVSFAWITNCAWRYYLNYKNENLSGSFHRVLTFLFLCSATLILIISICWVFLSENLLLRKLILSGYLYFVTNELINIVLVPLRIEGRSKMYNVLHASRIVISFAMLLFLTFIGSMRIEAFFISGLIINLFYLFYIVFAGLFRFHFDFTLLLKKDLKIFLQYGMYNLGFDLFMMVLISSDRYFLAIYMDINSVGIYNQIYNIAQISLITLFNVYQAAINPELIELLETKSADGRRVLKEYAYKTAFLFLPVAVLFTVFPRIISYILLGEEFREAWYLLPYIIAGVFFNGMNYYAVIKFKFGNRLKILLAGGALATALNVGLNILLIPLYGMLAAAVTTAVAYFFLWIFYYFKSDIRYLGDKKFIKKYIVLLVACFFIAGIYLVVRYFIPYDTASLLPSVLMAVGLIAVFLILTLKINPFIKRDVGMHKNRTP